MHKDPLFVQSPGMLGADGYVHIPITIADYLDEPNYKPTLQQRLRNKVAKSDDQKPRWISMSQEDYLAYWAKDEAGKLLPEVQDPAQGRVEWLRHQLRVNDQWRERGQMRSLANSPHSAVYWN